MVSDECDDDSALGSDVESVIDGFQSSTTESQSKEESPGGKTKALAKRESSSIARLRIIVFLILAAAAAYASVNVYNIASNAREREAEAHFDATADKIIEAFHSVVYTRLSSIASLGIAIMAHRLDHDRDWPYVTLSSFQHRGLAVREQSGALYLHLNPIVRPAQREPWETFVMQSSDAKWISEAVEYQRINGIFHFLGDFAGTKLMNKVANLTSLPIWHYDQEFTRKIIDPPANPYFPLWQASPLFYGGEEINENVARSEDNAEYMASYRRGIVAISDFFHPSPGGMESSDPRTSRLAIMMSTDRQVTTKYEGDPLSKIILPIFDVFNSADREVVAMLSAWIRWEKYFEGILPRRTSGIRLVLSDSCTGKYSFEVNGPAVTLLGWGETYDRRYASMKRSTSLAQVARITDGTAQGIPMPQDDCPITLDIYPSALFYEEFESNSAFSVTFAVALVFVTIFIFLVYDRLVERRQAIVLRRAQQTSAIVSSLFPEQVADRLIETTSNEYDRQGRQNQVKSFLSGASHLEDNGQPIADLFLNCTVLFADIAGFTAWSSSRDPAQVFILLQTIYQNFDKIAKRRKVFKVETIGDSYVAVTGLPEPQANHAVIMARFAGECMSTMNQLVTELESSLGPDTADLTMRFGLHSGPVTAGVLRGDRARFQLFGDTVNTAARMESTGVKSKIQISQATYDLLVQARKEHWLRPREEMVQAKGKGMMQTYWLNPTIGKKDSSVTVSSTSDVGSEGAALEIFGRNSTILDPTEPRHTIKQKRLVDWITDILQDNLKNVVSHRIPQTTSRPPTFSPLPGTTPMDEVVEMIHLPKYNSRKFSGTSSKELTALDPRVLSQLRQYVSIVASAYNSNPFHNFEHACHVTMAVHKFLKRIVAPEITFDDGTQTFDIDSKRHDFTHGITSDPLCVLAILFSALIHDVDHRGVSNTQLMIEQSEMAATYKSKSIAEQNSVDISWELLMGDQFQLLRSCMFANQEELDRFRQVLVNVVLATDIFDTELNELRRSRWEKAFADADRSDRDQSDLRATIVIEHIIQASDVAHTMQHWHVYRKWNRRLFLEMYMAYDSGRMAKDPSTFWYDGEIGFFDNYVIPLAKKLKDCNVFGVSSDECLTYAIQNRAEWADRGRELVVEMVKEIAEASSDEVKFFLSKRN